MPAPSLKQLATATAVKHFRFLDDLGSLPYSLARPILLKIDNPEKLHSLELKSPQIAEENEELWMEFIRRDIPQWETYNLPKKTNQWYEVYCGLRDQVQRSLDADAEKMKMAIDGINSERARLTPKIISSSRSARLPGQRPTARQRMVSYDRRMGGLPPGQAIPRSEMFAPAAKKRPSILAPQRRNNALAVPTQHLNSRASQVTQAPRGLVEEHRRPVEHAEQLASRRKEPVASAASGHPKQLASSTATMKTSSTTPKPLSDLKSDPKSSSLAQREARLKALTGSSPFSFPSTNTVRKVPCPPKQNSSSAPKPAVKRRAVSPPPQVASTPRSESSYQPSNEAAVSPDKPAARPPMLRKRKPDSVFIQPKRKRVS
ncbi:RNA polymerase II transcription factor SIII subunit A [Penicillium alfredii]|uniref:RNA polymerase II transcription factor SIII subunit A n=1 Tax=Penicillium alfredii TaxID=1506179 RepID=A0A9W9EM12_9EURO|nr:RNA polymerase II transcription factor SIII subunit A [Penicillium alfredii]KAJ5084220.1 RNA polymerase II transcription factor SIII subunit A [Penicillium alfredii]